MMNRSSAWEWAGSKIVIDNGSPNTLDASSKSTLCLAKLALALFSSHSKLIGIAQASSISQSEPRLYSTTAWSAKHRLSFRRLLLHPAFSRLGEGCSSEQSKNWL